MVSTEKTTKEIDEAQFARKRKYNGGKILIVDHLSLSKVWFVYFLCLMAYQPLWVI